MKIFAHNARKKVDLPPLIRVGLVQEPGTFQIGESVVEAKVGDVLLLDENDQPIDRVDDPVAWKRDHQMEVPLQAPPANTQPEPEPKKKAKARKKK